ncbi:retrovirus-related pol polyprotein from transposon TNT 1-94 [Tanacetum coccineum]
MTQQSQAEFPQLDFGLAVPTFQQGKDPVDCINKAMAFLSVVASRFPPSNNQLRTSSNPRNQATIQDGRVTVQQEGHMAKQCTQPMRPRISTWFKDKLMLAEAQEAAFQTEDLDAYDSYCDDISLSKAVLMANLSSCDSDVLSEVPYSDTYLNDMINQEGQEMPYSEQTYIVDFPDNEINSDSNIISNSQYLQESQDAGIQDMNSFAPNDLLVLSLVEQMTDHVATLDKENQTNKMVNESLTAELERYKDRVVIFEQRLNEIDTLKETFSNQIKEKESLSKTLTVFKIECKEKESKYMDKEIVLENQSKELDKYSFFEKVVKKRTISDAITAGAWGFEHTKACFVTEIIPFIKVLKDTFNAFDKTLLDENTEVQTVFNQREATVDHYFVDKNAFEIQTKQLSIDNDQLLKQIMSHKIVNIAVSSVDILNVNKSCVDECNKCLKLETELLKKNDLIEKDVYDKLLKSYSTLEKHCISLEITTQLNQEIFQKDNFCENQNVPAFNQLFEINELKARSQEKDTVIKKLKDRIKSLSVKDSVENVKKDIDEIEMINIELEHNQFDSIRKTRVQSKEHCASLITQINAKSVENSDLNAQIQEKVFASAALKNELRKLKGKNVVNLVVSKPTATTIAPGMFKLDIKPISHRLKNNRDTHEDYLKKTIENTDTMRGLVERVRTQNPSEPLLDSACQFTKHVQELFAQLLTSSSNAQKQVDSHITQDSNKPLLHSTGVKCSTGASGSKHSGNTKNNRISQPSCSNKTNNLEDQSRSVQSRKNKKNRVVKIECNAHVMQSMLNANSKSVCAICNECLFDANHDKCVLDYVHDVNENLKMPSESTVYDVPSSSQSLDYIVQIVTYGIWTPNAQANDLQSLQLMQLSKIKKHSHKPKAEDFIQEKLYLLHMDLCGPKRIQSINGRKYILVIVDDFSQFTWVKFLRSKDEVLEFVIKFLKMIQVRLNATVRNIRTDNGTESVNQTLKAYYEEVKISHQTSVARTP